MPGGRGSRSGAARRKAETRCTFVPAPRAPRPTRRGDRPTRTARGAPPRRARRDHRVADPRARPGLVRAAEDVGRPVGVHLGRPENHRQALAGRRVDRLDEQLVVGLSPRRRLGELHVVDDRARAVRTRLSITWACRARANGHCSPIPPSLAALERPRIDADARRSSGAGCGPRTAKRVSIDWSSRRSTDARADQRERHDERDERRPREQEGPAAPARRGAQPRRRQARPPAAVLTGAAGRRRQTRRARLVLAGAGQNLAVGSA